MALQRISSDNEFPRNAIIDTQTMVVGWSQMTIKQAQENLASFLQEISDPNSKINEEIRERTKFIENWKNRKNRT